jgi:hypothetical protein
MRSIEKRVLAVLIAASALAVATAARAEWAKSYRDNFVNACVKSVEGMGDPQKATRSCTCMAEAMEAKVSDTRLMEIEKMPEGEQKKAALMPLLEGAKAKCQGQPQ